jgi:hypothetical protein
MSKQMTDEEQQAYLKCSAERVARQDPGWYDDYNRYWSKPSDIFKEGYGNPFPPSRRRPRKAT